MEAVAIDPGGCGNLAARPLLPLSPYILIYSLPMFGLFLNAGGVIHGYLATNILPVRKFRSRRPPCCSRAANSIPASAPVPPCLRELPSAGTYVVSETPAELPLPAAALLLATPLALLAARSGRR